MKAAFRVRSVRDIGIQFADNQDRMAGQDGAYSIPLYNGKSLWFFGDTLIGERFPGKSLWYTGEPGDGEVNMSGLGNFSEIINNTGLLLPDQTVTDNLSGFHYILNSEKKLKQLIPHMNTEDHEKIRVWCLHGCKINNKIILYYVVIRMIPDRPVPSNFEIVGSGIAEGSEEDWEFTRIKYKGSTIIWGNNQPDFGAAVCFKPDSDYVYLYGVMDDVISDKGQQCYVSRVKPSDILNPGAYRYYSHGKPEWSDKVEDAEAVFSGIPNEMSVSYKPYLQKYLAVHSLALSGDIVGRTSVNPWGPWSEPGLLWRVKPTVKATEKFSPLIYAGKEHSELMDRTGKIIYITYIEFEEYYPHLIEIQLQ